MQQVAMSSVAVYALIQTIQQHKCRGTKEKVKVDDELTVTCVGEH